MESTSMLNRSAALQAREAQPRSRQDTETTPIVNLGLPANRGVHRCCHCLPRISSGRYFVPVVRWPDTRGQRITASQALCQRIPKLMMAVRMTL